MSFQDAISDFNQITFTFIEQVWKEKRKALLEDEVDHIKYAFSVHQVSECSVQNCQGTDHWDNESSPSPLSSGSLQTFPHPWRAPLTQAPGEGAAQAGR